MSKTYICDRCRVQIPHKTALGGRNAERGGLIEGEATYAHGKFTLMIEASDRIDLCRECLTEIIQGREPIRCAKEGEPHVH